MSRKYTFGSLLVLLLLAGAQGAEAKKEGFGIMKKLVNLNRLNPPVVLIPGTRLQVVGKGEGQEERAAATQIASKIGSEMVQYDRRLTLDAQRPQTVVEVSVLSDSYETQWLEREGYRQVENGTDSKGRKQYRNVPVTLRYQAVSHRFGVSYTVQDLSSKKTIYADTLEISFRQEFQDGHGAPTQADRASSAIQQTVNEIVYKLVPTPETIQVMVPKGTLEDWVNLAEAGLWSRYSEAIESKAAFPAPADEAYRQYALGLSFEALGYGAEDQETTLRYLEQAAQHYNTALSLNPKEDYFTEAYEGFAARTLLSTIVPGVGTSAPRRSPAPLQRVQEAMGKYQTLLNQNETLAIRQAEVGAKTLGGAPSAAGMKNEDVVAMVQGGVPEEIVLQSIDDAAICAFDTSPTGLIALAKAKMSKPIMQKIQAKACG